MEFNEKLQRYCPSCKQVKNRTGFYTGWQTGEYLPICRQCCIDKYKKAYNQVQDRGAALYSVLCQLDIPMLRNVWDVTNAECNIIDGAVKNNTNVVDIYYKNYKQLNNQRLGIIDTELELSDFLERNDKTDNNNGLVTDKQRQHWDKVWGSFEDEDCIILDDFYHRYTESILHLDTAQELRYRDLCKAELRKRKIDEGQDKSTRDSKDVTDEILKLMKLLKIDNFQDNQQSEEEKFIEHMAWKIENEEPAECEDLNKYKDFSNIEPVWNNILRCLKNLVAGTKQYPDIPKEQK